MFMHRPVTSAYESVVTNNDKYYLEAAVHRDVLKSKKVLFTVVREEDYYKDSIRFRLDVAKQDGGVAKSYRVDTLEELAQMINAIGLLEH